ncbi:Uncharacterised protein [Vibrio cholerae]|nr:Uncharacterised protein [Vibrio cholerae]
MVYLLAPSATYKGDKPQAGGTTPCPRKSLSSTKMAQVVAQSAFLRQLPQLHQPANLLRPWLHSSCAKASRMRFLSFMLRKITVCNPINFKWINVQRER